MRNRILLTCILAAALAAGLLLWRRSTPASNLGQAAHTHTANILAFGPRPPASDALNQVRAYLRKELASTGWTSQPQGFDRATSRGNIRFENVRARFPNNQTDPWQSTPTAILGAHVDSKWYPNQTFLGADDAASACAAILVIARELASKHPSQASQIELVFFDGEEAFGPSITAFDGLYGSRHYANLWRSSPSKPAFGIILDMIGHRNLHIALPSDTPDFLRIAVLDAAKQENALSQFSIAPGPIIDDHTPLNLAGIPTVDIIGDFTRSGWWHTTADSIELIDAKSLDLSIQVALRTLLAQLKTTKR